MEVRGDPSWITLVLAGVALILLGYVWIRFDLFGRRHAKQRIDGGETSFLDDLMAYRPYFFLGAGVLMAVAGIVVGVMSLIS